MHLAAVLNDRVVGQTVSPAAPIAGILHAGERAANRVRIAAVHRIRFAVGPRFDTLDVIYWPGASRGVMMTRRLKKFTRRLGRTVLPGPAGDPLYNWPAIAGASMMRRPLAAARRALNIEPHPTHID
jgi:hypothetical protein